jgi:hypothetical protein
MKLLSLSLALSALLLPPAAGAKPNPYTPQQVCGSAFSVVDSQAIATPTKRLATTYLLFNPNTGRNCAVTMKEAAVGRRTSVGVILQRQGGEQKGDSGDFKFYAGPVKVKARHTCVRWGGGARVGTQSAGFDTDYEHCA